jgi:hypothetical protein
LLNVAFVALATQTILSKIPPNNSKLTYVWEQYLFHYISEGGFTYLVMADDAAGRCVSGSPFGVGKHSPYLRNVPGECLSRSSENSSARYIISYHCVLNALTVA